MVDIEDLHMPGISEVNGLVGEYSFVVKGAKTVRVKIWYTDTAYGGSRYYFTQSHFFHGPKQAGPYVTGDAFADSEEEALRKAVRTLTSFFPDREEYREVDASTWFVKNRDF